VTSQLQKDLLTKADDDLVDVVIELSPPASPAPSSGMSRAERAVALKQRFTQAAEPVEQRIRSVGGRVVEQAWINQTLRAQVPAGKVDQVVDADEVASIDRPERLTRD
jgi:hypothetical protein